jgi:hypothetical protein
MRGLNEQELQAMSLVSNGDCSRSNGQVWNDVGLGDIITILANRGLVVFDIPCSKCQDGVHTHHTPMGKLVLQYHLLSVQSFDL